MKKQTHSPAIESFKWGSVTTAEGNSYKDVMLYPGGSREWDWNRTGTSHVPGILPEDVQFLLDRDAEVIILSKGVNERLRTSDKTFNLLKEKNIPYYQLQTEKAIERYNKLCKEKAVGALIHSTC